jgi:hypothetical protein
MNSKGFSKREKEIIQYGLSLLYDMIETCRIMKIPEIEGVPLPTLEEVGVFMQNISIESKKDARRKN